MKNRHVAALTIAATAAIVPGPRASAKADLKTAGDSCKKEGSTAAASDGHELKCTAKRWAVTANTIPEKDMPGGKPNPGALYPNRPGRQKEDQEAAVGGAVRLTGRTTTVTAARITPGGQLVLHVKVFNRDSKAKSYNTFDWQAQTPNGQVIDPTFSSSKDLGSGDLVRGRRVLRRHRQGPVLRHLQAGPDQRRPRHLAGSGRRGEVSFGSEDGGGTRR